MNGANEYASEGDGTNYLASVSDLMSGLIFVFIITLMVFALSFKEYEHDLTNTEVLRAELLAGLEQSLKAKGIEVTVDPEHGILRLPEEILFPLGSADLTAEGQNAIRVLSEELAAIIPCYAGKPDSLRPDDDVCGENWRPGRIDTILIEGHTDDIRLMPGSRYKDNWELSSARAIRTHTALTGGDAGSVLLAARNRDNEPVVGVSGYADLRPVPGNPNVDDASRARNRRIDLRFVMAPPKVSQSAEELLDDMSGAPGANHAGT